MELYNKILKTIEVNFIACLFYMILFLVLSDVLFKDRFPTKKVLRLYCWVIIVFTLGTLIQFLFISNQYSFLHQAIGLYKIAYWSYLICVLILPLTLLIKRFHSSYGYVLVSVFLMNIALSFEPIIILVTSIHRDSISGETLGLLLIWGIRELILMIQGLVIVIFSVGLMKWIEKRKA